MKTEKWSGTGIMHHLVRWMSVLEVFKIYSDFRDSIMMLKLGCIIICIDTMIRTLADT